MSGAASTSGRTRRRARRRAVVASMALAGAGCLALTGCDRGSSTPGTTKAAASTPAGAASTAATAACLVGRWNVPAKDEFVQMGLDQLTGGAVRATSGTIQVVFAADHSYTFSYDKVQLSVGGGAGSASVNGPVTGTWRLAADRLTTTVGSSRIAVDVKVAGVTVAPSQSLNDALSNGLPGAAKVRCAPGMLVATVTTGSAAGRQVTFGAG